MQQVAVTSEMEEAIGVHPLEAWLGRDLVCVLPHENDVINASPDFDKVKALDGLLLNITAKGSKYDTVTRSFAPKLSVKEDPVCGSGHCHVIPLWANKLAQEDFRAYQASDFSFVVWRAIGFILQERLPSIVVEKFMSWTKFLSITKT